MKRINVIGTSGSGKSHFSKLLAEQLNIPYIEIDAIHWLPNWEHLETQELLDKLKALLEKEAWVLDGNYSKTNPMKWQYVDTVIWLDYGFFHTLKQLIFRSFKRAVSKDELWPDTGNTESFRRSFFSKDSVILWMLHSYRINKKKYAKLFASEEFNRMNLVRIRSLKQADLYLENAKSSWQGN